MNARNRWKSGIFAGLTLAGLLLAGPAFAQDQKGTETSDENVAPPAEQTTASTRSGKTTRSAPGRTEQRQGTTTSRTTSTAGSSMGGASMGPRLFVMGQFGFGGELEGDVETEQGSNSSESDFDYGDNKATYGFGVHFGYPLHRFFTVGGRTSLLWYGAEDLDDNADVKRLMLWNTDVAPKGRYPFAGGAGEAYVTVPVGPSLNFPNEDLQDNAQDGIEYKTQVSWNISLLFGASYNFSPSFGAFTEIGWYNQNVKTKAEGEVNGTEVSSTSTGSFSQFALNAGVVAHF